MSYDYFYGQSGELFSYFRIPKALFQDCRFRQLSTDARTLYGILLDRMSLSAKNGWLDEQGRVYIIYTVREVQESLCCAEHKAVKLFRELEDIDLIERKRRGLGRPSLIYVKNFSSGLPKAQVQNCPNSNSGAAESAILEQPKPQANKTYKNNTEMSYTDIQSINQSDAGLQNFSPGVAPSVENDGLIEGIDRNAVEEAVKEQIDYDCLVSNPDSSVVQMVEEIKDLMVDVLCGERSVVSEGKRVSEETAKAAYRKITF